MCLPMSGIWKELWLLPHHDSYVYLAVVAKELGHNNSYNRLGKGP